MGIQSTHPNTYVGRTVSIPVRFPSIRPFYSRLMAIAESEIFFSVISTTNWFPQIVNNVIAAKFSSLPRAAGRRPGLARLDRSAW